MLRRLALIPVFLIFFFANHALAYSEKTTHPALTNEILDFSGGLSAEERAWVVEGSQLEDTPPRWINHFYDPINNTGWTGVGAGSIPPETLNSLVSIGVGEKPLSALDWVKGCNTQSAYYANGGNRTWDKALDYYAQGNMKEAYITLGYILHIEEDMGVPDHTRDDTHAQDLGGDTGSPYEQYTAKFDPQTIKALKISEGLKSDGLSAPKLNSLRDYLEAMAAYSNKYFFSKDTINDIRYPQPKILWDDGDFAYGTDENGQSFPLSAISAENDPVSSKKTYFLEARQRYLPIFDAYFAHLSRQIVLNGAGIVKFFQKQAEDAKTNSEFFVDSQHTLGKVACATGDTLSIFNPMGIVSGIGNVLSSALGQIASTLKSGLGFVVGLVAPRAAPLAPPSTPAEEPADTLPADTATDFAPDTEEAADASSYSSTTGTLRMATSVAPMAPVPPRTPTTTALTKTLTATTTPKVLGVATTTATGSSIAHASGGNTPAQNQAIIDDIIEENPDETSTSTATNSTSTESIATTTEAIATSTANHILISEILFDADGPDAGKEFIELYNPTDSPKDLTGYSLHYKAENSTTTHTLAVVHSATSTEQPVIPPHGFLLFGFDHYDSLNYGGVTADISRPSYYLPNGSNKIQITLLDTESLEIDRLVYDKNSITAPGKSLERLAWNGACASSTGSGEFLGNGCAIGEIQFEPRQNPRPQNSENLPEPREKPTAPVAQDGLALASYDPSTLAVSMNWTVSHDGQNSTSGITYMLYDISSSTPILISTTTAITSSMGAQPGRTYNLGLLAEDRDGLSSATTTFSVDTPGFLDKIYFYRDPRATTTARYLIDVRYSDARPLIPPVVDGSHNWWEAMAFYLNREPNPVNSRLPGDGSYSPGSHSDILQFPIFSFDPAKSLGYGQGLYHSSFVLPVEDGRLVLDSGLASAASSDYITVAYYNHVMNGGNFGVGDFVLAATDARKIYLSDLTDLPPTTPQNLNVSFDPFHMQLGLSWASSTDPDSPDAEITYEINYSTSTELASSTWRSVDKSLSTQIGVSADQNYIVGVRAVDDFGTRSPEITKRWDFPADYKPILLGHAVGGGYQDFVVPQDGALTELNIYTTDFYISGVVFPGPAFLCNISVYEMINGTPNLLVTGDIHPADGESGAYAYRSGGCAGNLTFTFSGKPQFLIGHSYRWEYAFSKQDYHYGNPTVKFYGRDTNTAGGAFGDTSIANAMFTLKTEDGILIQN